MGTVGDFGGGVGPLWFAIWLEMAIILGVMYTLASDTIGMHRLQISAFTAVALVFSVTGTNGLFSIAKSAQAYGAGWLLLTISNIVWLLYFTSEEDSLIFHIINQIGGGTGGLTPPSRIRRRNPSVMGGSAQVRQSSLGNGGAGYNNSTYQAGGNNSTYQAGGGPTSYGGGGIGSGFENGGTTEAGLGAGTPRGGGSLVGGPGNAETRSNRSVGGQTAGGMTGGGQSTTGGQSPRTPLMSAAGGPNTMSVVSGGDPDTSGQALTSGAEDTGYAYRARALYAYSASPDDPNEVSFAKGEILDIVDNAGKWWQAKKADGTTGIAPSNYLQII
ncbi:Transmembrane osmosensor [Tulasnella sp. 331]|nr:Transmembrane osmosensor [Tulasnella sp. 331]